MEIMHRISLVISAILYIQMEHLEEWKLINISQNYYFEYQFTALRYAILNFVFKYILFFNYDN